MSLMEMEVAETMMELTAVDHKVVKIAVRVHGDKVLQHQLGLDLVASGVLVGPHYPWRQQDE